MSAIWATINLLKLNNEIISPYTEKVPEIGALSVPLQKAEGPKQAWENSKNEQQLSLRSIFSIELTSST